MRILHLNDYAVPLGGAERYVEAVSGALRARGHEVVSYGTRSVEPLSSYVTRFWNPVASREVSRLVERFRPDVVHAHNVARALSPSAVSAAKRFGAPVVMTLHDFHLVCPKTSYSPRDDVACARTFDAGCVGRPCFRSPYRLLKGAKVSLHRRLLRDGVDAFVAPSHLLAERIARVFPGKRVVELPNFVDLGSVAFAPLEHTSRVLYVGRLAREKGVDVLVRAAPRILDECPRARFTIAGSGLQRGELESLAGRLGLSGSVEFAGFVSASGLGDHYRRSEVVVIPSRWAENSPLVLFEALGHGRPVVASDMGALPEFVGEGFGRTFRSGDAAELAGKVAEILGDAELAARMSRAARREAEERYSLAAHVVRLEAIYGSLLDAPAR